jgi:transposase
MGRAHRAEIADGGVVGTLGVIDAADELRQQEILVGIALAVGIGRPVDRHVVDEAGEVGALVEIEAVDDPERFRFSRTVGPHFGLTPRKYPSGETDYTERISKIGDAGVRSMLYEAANVILTHPVRGFDLKSWALAVARRAGMRKAKAALARKLAVVLHRMLRDQTTFVAHWSAPMAA